MSSFLRVPLLILVALVAAALTPATDAGRVKIEPKIVGGVAVTKGAVPYQVSIQSRGQHFCGGCIIDDGHVLTAAHCMYWKASNNRHVKWDVRSLEGWVGSNDLDGGDGSLIYFSAVSVHDDYAPGSPDRQNDIALLTVNGKIQFGDSVKPIHLAAALPAEGTECFVSGFGLLSETGTEVSADLMRASVRVVDLEHCKTKYKEPVTDRMVCAGGEENVDACLGDSGGPLVCSGTLSGLVSFGAGCGRKGIPGVYTNVARYVDWVRTTKANSDASRTIVPSIAIFYSFVLLVRLAL